MNIIETTVEDFGPGRIRVTSIIDLTTSMVESGSTTPELGEGPTGDAVPDRIVRSLITRGPGSVSLGDIYSDVGGNHSTVNTQAHALATNKPDLQIRLRGWVVRTERGRYALSPAARAKVGI